MRKHSHLILLFFVLLTLPLQAKALSCSPSYYFIIGYCDDDGCQDGFKVEVLLTSSCRAFYKIHDLEEQSLLEYKVKVHHIKIDDGVNRLKKTEKVSPGVYEYGYFGENAKKLAFETVQDAKIHWKIMIVFGLHI